VLCDCLNHPHTLNAEIYNNVMPGRVNAKPKWVKACMADM
jgi:hypothetical protein